VCAPREARERRHRRHEHQLLLRRRGHSDGREALVASGDGDLIKRVSLPSNVMTGSIDYGSNQDPHNIAITPDGAAAVAVGSSLRVYLLQR
jgi:hypothetical protein